MPSSMIHLLTGLAFTHSSNMVRDKSQFFLGCIAPDAVNVYGFAPKEIRTKAHLRSKDLDEWIQNAIDFYTDNQGVIQNDLLLGYVLHAFCDLSWDKKYEGDFYSAISALQISEDERAAARWNEFYYFDKTQESAEWWINEVKPLLESAQICSINGITEIELTDFKNYVLTDYLPKIKPVTPQIITAELINEFIYYAVANFKNQL